MSMTEELFKDLEDIDKVLEDCEYLEDKKKYWINYLENRLSETNDPIMQQKIIEMLKGEV